MSIFHDLQDPIVSRLHIHPLLLYAILLVLCALFPATIYYEGYVYGTDVIEYEELKRVHDAAEDARLERLRDTLYREWVATHDTTLREVARVDTLPVYHDRGYWRKTGRMICKEREERKDLVCEPETEFVVTGKYLAWYSLDTVWTYGYTDREEWVERARYYAREESERRRVELPYTGHPENFISESWWILVVMILSIASYCYLCAQLFGLVLILVMKPIGWIIGKFKGKDE